MPILWPLQWVPTPDDEVRGRAAIKPENSHSQDQLEFKREVITKAFKRYSGSNDSRMCDVDSTHPSPKDYGYRTKITPHFDMPRSAAKNGGQLPGDIGFVEKGRRRILDIEGQRHGVATNTRQSAQ
jgi:tRNA/tmRNA/rRNA uracil-C5-methylase (TrmA/RlmC/RlmD family)